jgi:hypothetical protein
MQELLQVKREHRSLFRLGFDEDEEAAARTFLVKRWLLSIPRWNTVVNASDQCPAGGAVSWLAARGVRDTLLNMMKLLKE